MLRFLNKQKTLRKIIRQDSQRIWWHICIFFQRTDQRKKNPKEPPSQRTKTLQTMDRQATTERTPAPNSTYKKLAV